MLDKWLLKLNINKCKVVSCIISLSISNYYLQSEGSVSVLERINNNIKDLGITTEVYLGYIPAPANTNFALGSDAVRGQLKVLYPATRWSRGRNPIGHNAMKTRERWNTGESL